MPIVGVFLSNSFSLVPLPWKIPLEEQHPEDKCSKSLELCTSVRQYTVLFSHFRPCDVLSENCFFQLLSYPRAYVWKTYNKRQIPLSCVQTDATLIVGCYMLGPFAHPVAFCWMFRGVARIFQRGVTEATHQIVISYYRGMKAHIN